MKLDKKATPRLNKLFAGMGGMLIAAVLLIYHWHEYTVAPKYNLMSGLCAVLLGTWLVVMVFMRIRTSLHRS